MSTGARRPREALPRWQVGLWTLTAVIAVTSLIVLLEALRHDHPAAGPLTPEIASDVDPLRDEVVCELPGGREGEEREEQTALPALPEEVTSNDLYDCPQSWDERRVRYVGEVVGGLLSRGEVVWTQVNDDVYGDQGAPLPTHRDFRGGNAGVGVLLPAADAAAIRWVGGPGQHGDVVVVTGVFHRVDESSGEVAVIIAEQASVLRAGRELTVPPAPGRSIVAVVFALLALGLTWLERSRRDQRGGGGGRL